MLLSAHRRHGTGGHRVLLVCDKPDTTVQRFVAGPGVYICNEYIELSAMIVADAAQITPEESSRRRSQYFDRSAEDILATPPDLGSQC
jgi:ATP-dependent protease Clp ATPase subunit